MKKNEDLLFKIEENRISESHHSVNKYNTDISDNHQPRHKHEEEEHITISGQDSQGSLQTNKRTTNATQGEMQYTLSIFELVDVFFEELTKKDYAKYNCYSKKKKSWHEVSCIMFEFLVDDIATLMKKRMFKTFLQKLQKIVKKSDKWKSHLKAGNRILVKLLMKYSFKRIRDIGFKKLLVINKAMILYKAQCNRIIVFRKIVALKK